LPGFDPPAKRCDPLWDALIDVCSWDEITDARRGWANGALPKLRKLGATPEQIRAKARAYHAMHGLVHLTPSALVKWWPKLPEIHDGWHPDPRRLLGEAGLPPFDQVLREIRREERPSP